MRAEATVTTTGRTGVEMEALTAVSVALLTVYDMAKAIDRGMMISDISLAAEVGWSPAAIFQELIGRAQRPIVWEHVQGSFAVNSLPNKHLCATYVGRTSTGVMRRGGEDS